MASSTHPPSQLPGWCSNAAEDERHANAGPLLAERAHLPRRVRAGPQRESRLSVIRAHRGADVGARRERSGP